MLAQVLITHACVAGGRTYNDILIGFDEIFSVLKKYFVPVHALPPTTATAPEASSRADSQRAPQAGV